MATASIPVDLANPGQVFACLGFLELADLMLGHAQGGFEWQSSNAVQFHVTASGNDDPIARALGFLEEATIHSLAPPNSANNSAKWKVDTIECQSHRFPFRDPISPATLPVCLQDANGHLVTIDYWGDETRRDNVKFWAGSGGYPGAALVRDALDLVRGRLMDNTANPFAISAPQSSSFRFDWRRDYVPMDAGFSPNLHGNVEMLGYPVVELLAAIGLANARPLRHTKLEYSYGVAGVTKDCLYDPIFLRAALGAQAPLFPAMPFRRFFMRLDWPGQENQARCITNVIEETLS